MHLRRQNLVWAERCVRYQAMQCYRPNRLSGSPNIQLARCSLSQVIHDQLVALLSGHHAPLQATFTQQGITLECSSIDLLTWLRCAQGYA